MNKILLLRSLIAGCATIMHFWITGVVFNNDFNCRTFFNYANNSDENKIACNDSLNNTIQWNCKCRHVVASDVYWVKIFDDGTVALASLIFIPLAIVEVCRGFFSILKICGDNSPYISTFEYCSFFGFFALLLNPSCFDVPIPSYTGESFMGLIDVGCIGLIFQYCRVSKTSIYEHYILVTLILCSCNGICHVINLRVINRRNHIAKNNNPMMKKLVESRDTGSQSKTKQSNNRDPVITVDPSVLAQSPPPYDDGKNQRN